MPHFVSRSIRVQRKRTFFRETPHAWGLFEQFGEKEAEAGRGGTGKTVKMKNGQDREKEAVRTGKGSGSDGKWPPLVYLPREGTLIWCKHKDQIT